MLLMTSFNLSLSIYIILLAWHTFNEKRGEKEKKKVLSNKELVNKELSTSL